MVIIPVYTSALVIIPVYTSALVIIPVYTSTLVIIPVYTSALVIIPVYTSTLVIIPVYTSSLVIIPVYTSTLVIIPVYTSSLVIIPVYTSTLVIIPVYTSTLVIIPVYTSTLVIIPVYTSTLVIIPVYTSTLVIIPVFCGWVIHITAGSDLHNSFMIDFRMLFPSAIDALFMQWPNCFEKIMTYGEEQVDWKQLLYFDGNLKTNDQKSKAAIHILPLLIPPGMKWKEGRKGPSKHATIDDACLSFVQVEKIGTNIPACLEVVKKTQPFLLALGKQEDPERVFVIIERQTVVCSSLLEGLDLF
ncbi:Repetitive proline-rich cell wall protein 2 [Holothuria leucospilota]|uniref:Repetitive proline-rich cell wall protein 2 n=1 Tax=Holothuria leucospilota TaxID=206669 RepID=A0A9Q1H6F4_HOLLE|nr:Repetitive proline-rich cell wall protein 2 [Holothuria leucospilota]